jgi:hypothetical protein
VLGVPVVAVNDTVRLILEDARQRTETRYAHVSQSIAEVRRTLEGLLAQQMELAEQMDNINNVLGQEDEAAPEEGSE